MAVVTIDAPNLLFKEIYTSDDSSISALAIYNDWKDWMLADGQNMGHAPAWVLDGAFPLPGGGTNASYFFLANGWKVQPAPRVSTGGRLRIVGNLYSEDGSEIYADQPTGPTIQVETEVSPQALGISGEEIRAAIFDAQISQYMTLGSAGEVLRRIYQRLALEKDLLVTHPGIAPGTITFDGVTISVAENGGNTETTRTA